MGHIPKETWDKKKALKIVRFQQMTCSEFSFENDTKKNSNASSEIYWCPGKMLQIVQLVNSMTRYSINDKVP